MTKIEPSGKDGFFLLNGIPYQKGGYEVKVNGSRISIVRISEGIISDDNLASLVELSDWRDASGNSFYSLAQFFEYLETFFYDHINEGDYISSIQSNTKSINDSLNCILEELQKQTEILNDISE